MKLKYYMRGIGIGVLVTTIILVVAFAFSDKNITDQEVIARAKKLGMVETNTTANNSTNTTADSSNNDTEATGNQTIPGATNPMPDSTANTLKNSTSAAQTSGDTVEFTINTGESSRLVVERLAEMGIISDAYTFNKYVNEKGIDGSLQPGTFKIKKGISEEELSNLLITKQQFRESV
ncbi:MAG: endolytic transglycosylase MltG [Lachnospiraceae bacterium]|nr:endolytic transglycosylase MltG [Lachnospiraceae bacterium]